LRGFALGKGCDEGGDKTDNFEASDIFCDKTFSLI
jgi:hypothetical protein